jgi:hypothetical protein
MSGKPANERAWSRVIVSLTGTAGHAELVLVNTLRLVGGLDRKRASGLYFAVDAQPSRYKIIRALCASEDQLKAAEIIIGAASRIFAKRNELAHSFLFRAKPGSNLPLRRVYLRNTKQPYKPVTEEYLIHMLEPVKADFDSLSAEYFKLCELCGQARQLLIE